VYDPTPPSIAVTSPTAEAAFQTTLSPLSIGGAASDNLEVQSVTWENTSTGENGTASGTGAWSIGSVVLVEGPNVIVVTAADGVGNTSAVTITVNYDGTPPTLDILTVHTVPSVPAPTPPATVDTSLRPLTISGTAGDNLNLTSVTWSNSLGGGGTATLTGASSPFGWNASVYLYPGLNVITVTATDGHGYTAVDVLAVNFTPESVAPGVSITGPSGSGSAISATQLAALSGTADDNVGVVQVRWINQSTGVRGTAVLTPASGPVVDWDADVPLASGVNVIVVTAVDDAGNTTSATITITYDSPSDAVLPAVTIAGPTLLDLWDASTSPLTLTISATDNVGIAAVTWSNAGTGGDGVASLVGGSTWTADVALAQGANTITVTARDAAGNTATDTLIVNFVVAPDAADPTVTITSHPTGTTVNVSDALLLLGGTASDNTAVAGVVWTNAATGGTGGADGTTTWAAGVLLVDGINVITVRAYDSTGRVDTDQITVLYTAPPLPPEVLPSGHCGLLGGEALLLLLGLPALRRRRR
ncbi:MAG TPA: hypothetical protein VEJ18_11000, partial [Planctomycetota bacterium]|nr:hypothetical protein [Planctomycetota bacterium]